MHFFGGSCCGRLGVCGSLGACFRVLWPLLVGPFGSVSLVGAFGFLCGCLRVFVVASGSLAFPLGAFLFLCFFCCCPLALLVALWFWRFVVLRVPQGSHPSPPQGASLSVVPPGVSLLVFIQTLGQVRAGYRRRRGRGSLRCSSEAGVCWVPHIDPP